jgi:hypothetical protein
MYPWECRRKTAAFDAVFDIVPTSRSGRLSLRPYAFCQACGGNVLTLVAALHYLRHFCQTDLPSPPPLPPGGPQGSFWDPPTLFVRFVHCRAKTGSLRIIAVSRNLFMGRTPSFSLAQTLYRVRSLLPTSPSHRHCCGCPPIPLLC